MASRSSPPLDETPVDSVARRERKHRRARAGHARGVGRGATPRGLPAARSRVSRSLGSNRVSRSADHSPASWSFAGGQGAPSSRRDGVPQRNAHRRLPHANARARHEPSHARGDWVAPSRRDRPRPARLGAPRCMRTRRHRGVRRARSPRDARAHDGRCHEGPVPFRALRSGTSRLRPDPPPRGEGMLRRDSAGCDPSGLCHARCRSGRCSCARRGRRLVLNVRLDVAG